MNMEVPNQVLSPWTEVVVQEADQSIDVNMYGRKYSFASSPFPTSIFAASSEILASPIRLVGKIDDKPIQWETKGSFIFRHNNACAVISGWEANKSIIINTSSQIEYDGMMRVDMVVMPQSGVSPKLEELWLEIPLNADKATLFHYWPGRWGSAENSGAVSEDGLVLPFKPFVWIGWEDGGLSWFAESDKGWQSKENCIEVLRQGNETILRLHILDYQPQMLPLTITFGFQATPVKPIPKNFHEWRICHGANYGIDKQIIKEGNKETILDKMTELGVKTLVFHEHWTPIQNYWETTKEIELKQLIDECHKRGIKLLLYFGYELSTLAPEWGRLADEVLVKNTNGGLAGGYHRYPEQRDYIICYNSKWQDYFVEGIAKAIEVYGFDGVYLDGTIEPWGCANEKHGCGYRTSDGNLKVTYPIFAVRKLMRRLYEIIHPKGGLINPHQSTCCVTPTLTFSHSYWDGEQFGSGELAGDPLQKLPLSAFRAEFMGKNFGVPCEFLVYEKQPTWTFEHALAFTMLHDVLVRPGGFGRQLELMSSIWKVMTDFGVGDAEWHPYWRNEKLINAQPESVKVSFYHKKDKLLLVASNLSANQAVDAQIRLNNYELGYFKYAHNAITKESYTINENKMNITLQPMRVKLIYISN
ncbi:MAG: glycoside hydrolase domain-containing protein [bacterium]